MWNVLLEELAHAFDLGELNKLLGGHLIDPALVVWASVTKREVIRLSPAVTSNGPLACSMRVTDNVMHHNVSTTRITTPSTNITSSALSSAWQEVRRKSWVFGSMSDPCELACDGEVILSGPDCGFLGFELLRELLAGLA